MRAQTKIIAAIFTIMMSILIGYVIISTNINRKKNLSYNFDGIVQSVFYDVKGTPYVTVNGYRYYLSAGYNFDHQIKQGDRLKKYKNSNVYFLVKSDTNDTVKFDNGSY